MNPMLKRIKHLVQMHFRLANMERKWIFPLATATLVSLFLVLVATLFSVSNNGTYPVLSYFRFKGGGTEVAKAVFVESKISSAAATSMEALPPPPRLAYLISGSRGDGKRLVRTLQALYHPLNQYVVHLDLESSPRERVDLAYYVKTNPIFAKVGNVHMITKANLITYRGPTMVANTLHAAAILLKKSQDWDWFINLSASDYPLVSQDDLLHTFSYLPRDFNFIEHTSNIGWKEHQRARPIIIDPGLYMSKKSDVFWVSQKRGVPTSFKLFTGSAWMALSRAFIEFCIWGWDNLPRTVLMYYANFISSPEGYFHTVICNAQEFQNTTVNHDLHYISWDTPPRQHPHSLGLQDFEKMNESNAPFARKFDRMDPVLDRIDEELLGRTNGSFVPGGWCIGNRDDGSDPCSVMGDRTVLKPGPGSKRLQKLIETNLKPCFRDQGSNLKPCFRDQGSNLKPSYSEPFTSLVSYFPPN